MPTKSERYRAQLEVAGGDEPLLLEEAVERVKKLGTVPVKKKYKKARPRKGFDQSVEIVMQLGIDPKQADQMLRGSVALPKGIGKTKRVVAFCDAALVDAAKAAGAVEAGGDELIQKIQDGWMDFDVAVAHPQLMRQVSKLGRLLGPQGKMPSPKSGTVTPDVESAVREYAAGKIEYRNDAGGNIHAVVGKVSFASEDLRENIEAFIEHIRKRRPAAAKGHFIKSVHLSATMSPSVRVAVG